MNVKDKAHKPVIASPAKCTKNKKSKAVSSK